MSKIASTVNWLHGLTVRTPEPYLNWILKPGVSARLLATHKYRRAEIDVHGVEDHEGTDFEVPWGTPVLAPFSGWYAATFEERWADRSLSHHEALRRNPDETQIRMAPGTHSGVPLSMWFGLGLFIHGMDSKGRRQVQIGHLSEVDRSVPYLNPQIVGRDVEPSPVIRARPVDFVSSACWIEAGEIIGASGMTGCGWGQRSYPPLSTDIDGRPFFLEGDVTFWTNPHIHLTVLGPRAPFTRYAKRFDPWGIYGERDKYPPVRQRRVRHINAKHQPLWVS